MDINNIWCLFLTPQLDYMFSEEKIAGIENMNECNQIGT